MEHPAGGAGRAHTDVTVGTRLHITEALQRDPRKVVDIHVTVQELGDAGAVIVSRLAGSDVVRMENEFGATRGDTRYVTRMSLGDDTVAGPERGRMQQ